MPSPVIWSIQCMLRILCCVTIMNIINNVSISMECCTMKSTHAYLDIPFKWNAYIISERFSLVLGSLCSLNVLVTHFYLHNYKIHIFKKLGLHIATHYSCCLTFFFLLWCSHLIFDILLLFKLILKINLNYIKHYIHGG